MRVLVSDTSVIIDLERGDLLREVFRLPFEFAVPDLLFNRELNGELGRQLVGLGLRVEELTGTEVSHATTVHRSNASLSVPDAFAFSLATVRRWTLLTGDGGLRQFALKEGLIVHGVLWLIDQLENGRHVSSKKLHTSLSAITAHPRCRLPAAETKKRLARYAAAKKSK